MIVLFFPFARDLTYLYKRLRYTYVHGPKINFNVEIIGVTFWIKIPIDHANRDLSPTLRAPPQEGRLTNARPDTCTNFIDWLAAENARDPSSITRCITITLATRAKRERERVYRSVDRNFARDECRAVKEFTMFVSRDVGNTSRGLYVDKTKLSLSDLKSRTFVRDIFLRMRSSSKFLGQSAILISNIFVYTCPLKFNKRLISQRIRNHESTRSHYME